MTTRGGNYRLDAMPRWLHGGLIMTSVTIHRLIEI